MLESLFNKVADLKAPPQVFSCEYCEIFKNTYFEEHLRTAASDIINIIPYATLTNNILIGSEHYLWSFKHNSSGNNSA